MSRPSGRYVTDSYVRCCQPSNGMRWNPGSLQILAHGPDQSTMDFSHGTSVGFRTSSAPGTCCTVTQQGMPDVGVGFVEDMEFLGGC